MRAWAFDSLLGALTAQSGGGRSDSGSLYVVPARSQPPLGLDETLVSYCWECAGLEFGKEFCRAIEPLTSRTRGCSRAGVVTGRTSLDRRRVEVGCQLRRTSEALLPPKAHAQSLNSTLTAVHSRLPRRLLRHLVAQPRLPVPPRGRDRRSSVCRGRRSRRLTRQDGAVAPKAAGGRKTDAVREVLVHAAPDPACLEGSTALVHH